MGIAYIALGGNLGNVRASFDMACRRLASLPRSKISMRSHLYRTMPLGPADQPMYLNAMVALATQLDPFVLLEALFMIERDAGRVRARRWGPRTLDLDLVAFDQRVINTPELRVPHPAMHQRLFVLYPLCDLNPGWVHPLLQKRADEMLNELLQAGEEPLRAWSTW